MPHPRWCDRPCATCNDPCELDASIPCSPDCEGLDGVTGETNSLECKQCSSIEDDS